MDELQFIESVLLDIVNNKPIDEADITTAIIYIRQVIDSQQRRKFTKDDFNKFNVIYPDD